MRIVSLLARHGSQKYPNAELRLNEIYSKQLPEVERFTLIIDNALACDSVQQEDESLTLIGGDNSAWEFSAWDRGLRYLGERIWSFDLVHLVTSAFDSLYTAYLDRFDTRMLCAMVRRPLCLGHIDCYNEPVRLLSFRSQHWMRSSFLFTPPSEIMTLRSLVSLKEPVIMFGPSSDTPFAPNAEISANYQRYILDWLTGGDIGQGTTWHSQFALTPESLSLFQAKAAAIMNEHLLSIRLRAQATSLIDTTWLSGQLETRNAESIDWTTPWKTQLASRKVDRLLMS